MTKLYVAAWKGPWGWRSAFYDWYAANATNRFELVDDIQEADIVFQCDLNNWRELVKLPRTTRIVANVLDFGEWMNNGELNQDTVEYVRTLHHRLPSAKFTAISTKVQSQLATEFGITAQAFYYPSQVTSALVFQSRPIAAKKRKQFISFCRAADPGKGIQEAITAFQKSGLADKGWRYIIAGPEQLPPGLPKGVIGAGYLDTDALYTMVAQSKYVLMPSYGEGLGLPIIEGLLVGTPFVTRNIEPMASVFKDIWNDVVRFDEDGELPMALKVAANLSEQQYIDFAHDGFICARPWIRDFAFSSLANYITKEA